MGWKRNKEISIIFSIQIQNQSRDKWKIRVADIKKNMNVIIDKYRLEDMATYVGFLYIEHKN